MKENTSASSSQNEKTTYTPGIEVQPGPCDDHLQCANSNLVSSYNTSSTDRNGKEESPEEDFEATCKLFWEYCQNQFDDEKLDQLHELVLPRIEYFPIVEVIHPEPKKEPSCQEQELRKIHLHESRSKLESSTRRQMDRLIEKDGAQEVKTSETELTSQLNKALILVQFFVIDASCRGCGLNCIYQLRACVNMIQVFPSVKEVKAREIPILKRTAKRQLRQHWIPKGMFDVKEQIKSHTIDLDDECAKPYIPHWRKRRRRTPSTSDSHD